MFHRHEAGSARPGPDQDSAGPGRETGVACGPFATPGALGGHTTSTAGAVPVGSRAAGPVAGLDAAPHGGRGLEARHTPARLLQVSTLNHPLYHCECRTGKKGSCQIPVHARLRARIVLLSLTAVISV